MTAEIIKALRARFTAPEWALFTEVPDATGHDAKRSADAVAMSLYPSKGLELYGFEVKVQRRDWLRELRNADKSADMIKHVDRWYIVAPQGVVKKDEVPAAWGWVCIEEKRGAVIRKPAPQLGHLDQETMGRPFVAALLRRAQEYGSSQTEVAKALAQGKAEGRESATAGARAREFTAKLLEDNAAREIERQVMNGMKPLRDLEEKLGHKLSRYGSKDAETFRIAQRIRDLGLRDAIHALALVEKLSRPLLDEMRKLVSEGDVER